jgi:N-acetylglucosaminyldiphosphoundecaprenol N-acetyl-beta-D-mannosaminyltransferase
LAVERINFLNVPLDIVSEEDIEGVVLDLLSRQGPQHIMLVTLQDVLRARRKGEFRSMVQKAALVIPLSKSIISGAAFLKKRTPVRYHPFTLIISLLTTLEKYHRSVYLFGARQKSLLIAERNVRSTFPKLSIVGRFPGYFHRSMERNIVTAILKSNPSLVILSDGIPSGQRWIHRNRTKLHNGIFIYNNEVIDVFSERKRRVSERTFERGLEFFPEIIKNPLRFFIIFQYLWYNILLLAYRLFRTS